MRNKVHFHCLFEGKILIVHLNEKNHIQNFHLGRYIVGYTFGNHVLRLRLLVAVKLNFRPYIRRYTSPNENFEYSYPLNMSNRNNYPRAFLKKQKRYCYRIRPTVSPLCCPLLNHWMKSNQIWCMSYSHE